MHKIIKLMNVVELSTNIMHMKYGYILISLKSVLKEIKCQPREQTVIIPDTIFSVISWKWTPIELSPCTCPT